MKISILGAGGFLGRKLAAKLAADGALGDRAITSLTLFDLAPPTAPRAIFPVHCLAGDIAELPQHAIGEGTEMVFHLAAVVSGAAEADYALGQRVNLHGTEAVIRICQGLPAPPRLVFASSIASFSGGQNTLIGDDARQIPANSYGAQKAAAELLLGDATRRGFLDAVSLRMPTVVVRPGRPNQAASSFFSAILREPLLGLTAELPVPDDFLVCIASPRRTVDWLLHAAMLDGARLGLDRSINLPGLIVTVGAMLNALEQARPGASSLVRRVPNPAIAAIVGGWPSGFAAARAAALGFSAHEPLIALIQAFVADDLQATREDRDL